MEATQPLPKNLAHTIILFQGSTLKLNIFTCWPRKSLGLFFYVSNCYQCLEHQCSQCFLEASPGVKLVGEKITTKLLGPNLVHV